MEKLKLIRRIKFTEEKIRKAFTQLGQERYSRHLGISVARKPEEVLIEEDLQNFRLTQYASPAIKATKHFLT